MAVKGLIMVCKPTKCFGISRYSVNNMPGNPDIAIFLSLSETCACLNTLGILEWTDSKWYIVLHNNRGGALMQWFKVRAWKIGDRGQTARARISNPVSGGQCHLINLTILRRFSWPMQFNLYMHTGGLKPHLFHYTIRCRWTNARSCPPIIRTRYETMRAPYLCCDSESTIHDAEEGARGGETPGG